MTSLSSLVFSSSSAESTVVLFGEVVIDMIDMGFIY